jgi:hypothetical protein
MKMLSLDSIFFWPGLCPTGVFLHKIALEIRDSYLPKVKKAHRPLLVINLMKFFILIG